jgi:transposase
MAVTRRKFTLEFKTEAAHRVIDSDRTVREVARELSVLESSLSTWVRNERRRIEALSGTSNEPLSTAERAELVRLRRQVSEQDKDLAFLGKAAAYFASNPPKTATRASTEAACPDCKASVEPLSAVGAVGTAVRTRVGNRAHPLGRRTTRQNDGSPSWRQRRTAPPHALADREHPGRRAVPGTGKPVGGRVRRIDPVPTGTSGAEPTSELQHVAPANEWIFSPWARSTCGLSWRSLPPLQRGTAHTREEVPHGRNGPSPVSCR